MSAPLVELIKHLPDLTGKFEFNENDGLYGTYSIDANEIKNWKYPTGENAVIAMKKLSSENQEEKEKGEQLIKNITLKLGGYIPTTHAIQNLFPLDSTGKKAIQVPDKSFRLFEENPSGRYTQENLLVGLSLLSSENNDYKDVGVQVLDLVKENLYNEEKQRFNFGMIEVIKKPDYGYIIKDLDSKPLLGNPYTSSVIPDLGEMFTGTDIKEKNGKNILKEYLDFPKKYGVMGDAISMIDPSENPKNNYSLKKDEPFSFAFDAKGNPTDEFLALIHGTEKVYNTKIDPQINALAAIAYQCSPEKEHQEFGKNLEENVIFDVAREKIQTEYK